MELKDIVISVMCMLAAWFSAGYWTDDQTVVPADKHRKFLVYIPNKIRWIFIFSRRSSRHWFLKISVVYEILGYVHLMVFLLGAALYNDPIILDQILLWGLYLGGAILYLFGIPIQIYCGYRSYRFKKENVKGYLSPFEEGMIKMRSLFKGLKNFKNKDS